jgi:hypothetical protein
MRFYFSGQATVEYIFILAFAVIFGVTVLNKYTEFFRDIMGGVSHVLSTHLIVGTCPTECWFSGYENSFQGTSP